MNYMVEFPHYDDTLIVPQRYQDLSWHNDICPHFERAVNPVKSVAIWCDFKDYSKRETGAMHRYTVALQDDIDKFDCGYFDEFEHALLFADSLAEKLTFKGVKMGAREFKTMASGVTATEAFRTAIEDALHKYGHAGYTGSIAEKDSFVMITKPADKDLHDFKIGRAHV